MKKIKQKLRKISAWVLAAVLFGSSFDGFALTGAAAGSENSAEIVTIYSLSGEVTTQKVKSGAAESEILLPDELEVRVKFTEAGGASAADETDTDAPEPVTLQETAPEPEETEPRIDGQPTDPPPDEAGNESADPGEPESVETGNESTEPGEPESGEAGVESTDPAESESGEAGSESADPAGPKPEEAGSESTDAGQPEEVMQPETEPTDDAADGAVPEAESPDTEQPETDAEEAGGILTSLLDCVFPAMTVHAAETANVQTYKVVTLTGIKWKIDAEKSSSAEFSSDESAAGNTYTYIPVLPDTVTIDGTEYTLEPGEYVELPEIVVKIAWPTDEIGTPLDGGTTGDCRWKVYDTDGDETADLLVIGGGTYMEDYSNANLWPWFKYRDSVTALVVEEGVEKIGVYSFFNMKALRTVDLPESLSVINERAFGYCDSLESIEIPDGVSDIPQLAFYFSENLKSVSLPANLKSIGGYAFNGCPLTEIDLPDTLTEIGQAAFMGCYLNKLIIPEQVTAIGQGAFDVTDSEVIYNLSDVDLTREMIGGSGTPGTVYNVTLKENGGAEAVSRKLLPSQAAAGTRYEGTAYDASFYFSDGGDASWFAANEDGSGTEVTAENEETVFSGNPALYYAKRLSGGSVTAEARYTGGLDAPYTVTVKDAVTGEILTEGVHYTQMIVSEDGFDEDGNPTSAGKKLGRVTVRVEGILKSFYGGTMEVTFEVPASARVELDDGSVTEYASVPEAFGSVGDGQTATITLLGDAKLDAGDNLVVYGNITLIGKASDGKEYSISGSHSLLGSGLIDVAEGGTLTIQSGTIINTAAGDAARTVAVYVDGELIVDGGTLSGSTCAFWSSSGDNVKLSGGTFTGNIWAVYTGSAVGKTLQEGYAFYEGETAAGAPAYGVNTADTALPEGTYTVGKCENHSYGGWSDAGDGTTHVHACEYCGAKETADHNWGAWTEDAESGTHVRICLDCGASESEEHTWGAWGADSSGKYTRACEDCAAAETAAASVSNSGARLEYYTSIEDAWAAAKERSNGDTQATLTLLWDVTVGTKLTVENGDDIIFTSAKGTDYTLFGNANETEGGLIHVAGGAFTLESGNIQNGENGSNAIAVSDGGRFFMEGGSAEALANGHSGICVYGGGNAVISGGSASGYNGLAIVDGGSGTVSGGTFQGTFPVSESSAAILLREANGTLKTVLGDGKAYYEVNGGVKTLITDLTMDPSGRTRLYGTVTVADCTHSCGVWTASEDGETHSGVCAVCGASVSEAHSYTWTDNGDGTHTGTCDVCGAKRESETHHYERCTDNGDGTHSGSCALCGHENTEAHVWNRDGICEACGAKTQIAASVTTGGDTVYFADIQEAWESAKAADGAAIVTLLSDVTVSEPLIVEDGDEITLESAGSPDGWYGISGELKNRGIIEVEGGSFTMNSGRLCNRGVGNGYGTTYDLYVSGGTAVVNDGEFADGGVHATGIYVVGGELTIKDCTVSMEWYALALERNGKVRIDGGVIDGRINSGGFSQEKAHLRINGGKITDGVTIYSNVSAEITGGTVTGEVDIAGNSSLEITGGTISGSPYGVCVQNFQEASTELTISGGRISGTQYGLWIGTGISSGSVTGGIFTGGEGSIYVEPNRSGDDQVTLYRLVRGIGGASGCYYYAVGSNGQETQVPEEYITNNKGLWASAGYGTVTVRKPDEEGIVSVEVSWDALEYTYTDGAWNPDTHAYGEGQWTAGGGNAISVKNKGNTDVSVDYKYSPSVPSVSGSFADGDGNPIEAPMELLRWEEKDAYLTLAGSPGDNFTSGTLGTVTVTIQTLEGMGGE